MIELIHFWSETQLYLPDRYIQPWFKDLKGTSEGSQKDLRGISEGSHRDLRSISEGSHRDLRGIS